MRGRQVLLWFALAGAGLLWWFSRTPRGSVFVEEVTDKTAAAVEWVYRTVTRGFRNNNPGNIRYIAPPAVPWNGQVGNDAGYGVYESVPLSVRAIGKQLLKYSSRGLNTVRELISTWAPPADNNPTEAYVRNVAKALNVGADDVLVVSAFLPELAAAIIRQENGEQPYPMERITEWVYS